MHGNEKVCDMIDNENWLWPAERKSSYPILQALSVPALNEYEDKTVWITKDGNCVKYTVNRSWKDWRHNGDKVLWCDVVWFSHCTPKHSFIPWLAILGRLATQDRLVKWYPGKQVSCPLCETCPDSVTHVFFEWPFSNKIWRELKKKSQQEELSNNWNEILNGLISKLCNKSIMSILRRIVLAACVYYVWNERNKRLFANEKRDYKVLLTVIVNNIRLKLASKSAKIDEVSKRWQVYMNQIDSDSLIKD